MTTETRANELSRLQQERQQEAAENAARNVEVMTSDATATKANDAKVSELFRLAQRSNRRLKRTRLLLQAASAWAAPVATHAACREGCSHCCHIPVAITSSEAALLAEASGRSMVIPPSARRLVDLNAVDEPPEAHETPCPFLKDHRCSVYEARPSICRVHMNLDKDDLLCRLVPGRMTQVPYADKRVVYGMCLIHMADEVIADVREFFPQPTSVTVDDPS